MAVAKRAYCGTLYRDDIAIGLVRSFTLPELSRPEIDTTTTDNCEWASSIPSGTRDPGSIEFVLLLDSTDAGQMALRADFDANPTSATLSEFKFTDSSGLDLIICDGYVTSVQQVNDRDEAKLLNVTVRLSGAPTTWLERSGSGSGS